MELLSVQKAALNAANTAPGFAYYMEMGLGKTLVALTEFCHLVSKGKATRMVVICPNSFKSGWQDEINKQGVQVHPFVFNSGSAYENDRFLKTDYKLPPVLIVNYEAIRIPHVREYIDKFISGKNCVLTIDESIQIKTYNVIQTKVVLGMAPKFQYVRLLSGKPVTSGPHDLWAQMRAIGAINTKYHPFKTTYCKMGGFRGKKVVGTQNEELLAALIDKFIFRASKKDWTDLPEKMYTSREYKLTPELLSMYKSMEDEFVLWINETENVAVDAFITKYIKLAQIQSGFIIKEDGSTEELISPEKNPRFVLVRELVEEADGKVIIPYIHRYTLGLLQRSLAEYNPAHIKGLMEPHEIKAQVDKFNKDPNCRVLLGQTRASKYGHTLLGGEDIDHCSTMIFAENSYSLDDRSQVEDRMHRHGQKFNCLYVDVWGTPLDRRVTAALQAKEDISQAVFQYFKKRSNNPALLPVGS